MKRVIVTLILLFLTGCSVSETQKQKAEIRIISVKEVEGPTVYGKYTQVSSEAFNEEMIIYSEFPDEINIYLEEFKKAMEKENDVKWVDSAKVSAKRCVFGLSENSDGMICFIPRMHEVTFVLIKEDEENQYLAYVPKLIQNNECEGEFQYKFANQSDDISVFRSGEHLEDMTYVFSKEAKYQQLQFYEPDSNGEWHAFTGTALENCDSFTLSAASSTDSATYKEPESIILYYRLDSDLGRQALTFKVELEEKTEVRINMCFFEEPHQMENKEILLGYIVFSDGGYDITDWNETVYTQSILPEETNIQIIAVCVKLNDEICFTEQYGASVLKVGK